MKVKLSIVALTVICLTACSKDKFTTKPQITFTSVNTQELHPNQIIRFTMHYTDKEGDIQNVLWVGKVTTNCEASNIESIYAISPSVPKQNNGEGDIVVTYFYGTDPNISNPIPPISEPQCPGQNDTCVYKFALTDVHNNTSDTISSPQIVLIKR